MLFLKEGRRIKNRWWQSKFAAHLVVGGALLLLIVYTIATTNLNLVTTENPVIKKSDKNTSIETESTLSDNGGCKRLGLPQRLSDIPLPPISYEMDRGQSGNFVMGILDNKEVHNSTDSTEEERQPLLIHLAIPRWLSYRINKNTGHMEEVGNSEHTWNRAIESKPEDGIFIDVGGWVGDSALPSAALGFDTYVFEPVRDNSNLIHYSILANECRISEHLAVVNALVGDKDSATESVYVVAHRKDNAAGTKEQALKNVKGSERDYEQPVHMIKLDTFFPSGTKVQNLKIDVQGFELHVLKGAERLLKENKGRLQVRFEYHVPLLKTAGTNPPDVIKFMEDLGYEIIKKGKDIDMK